MSPPRSTVLSRIVPLDDHERARIDARGAPAPPLHSGDGARVPRLGGDGAHRGERPRAARHRDRCRHHAGLSVRRPARPCGGLCRAAERGGCRGRSACWRCPASGSAAPGWRSSTIWRCAAAPARCSLRSTPIGRVIRELDRQEGMPGEEVGLTIDAGLQQAVLGQLGEESASAVVMDCRNGEVLAMATNAVVRSVAVQLRRVAGAMGGVDQEPPRAADQQGDRRAVCAGLHLQDGGGDGRRWRRGRSRRPIGSTARAISISATRGSIAGRNAAMACWICAAD